MKKCAFLTMDCLNDYVSYDHLLYKPFEEFGWSVETVSWRNREADWDRFDAVIIRSPWDYQKNPQLFLEVLEKIEKSKARLENHIELVRWNISKTYLRDLEDQDIEIVPSLWPDSFQPEYFADYFKALNTEEVVVKPVISAGADNTYRLRKENIGYHLNDLTGSFNNRPFLVQPFMPGIVKEGEFSVFFFGDTYSHTILKTPKTEDFRVQEEHGGRLKRVEPEDKLLSVSRKTLQHIDPAPLYSRIDYVRTSSNTFALMELELIEPSLYFNMDPDSPKRFAKVFDEWMNRPAGGASQEIGASGENI